MMKLCYVYATAMGAECCICTAMDAGKVITMRTGNANGPLMPDSIRDAPYGRTSPNRRWVPTLLSCFMTLSTEWVKSPFKALAHGGRGVAIDGGCVKIPIAKKQVSPCRMLEREDGWLD